MRPVHTPSLALSLCLAGSAFAQSADELAKKLSNPVASLISVPFQLNYNDGIGPDDGSQTYINIQPVIPFSISDNWNVISRTILPVIRQDGVVPDETQTGFGNITQSFFFSPKEPTKGGLIWGVGPVIGIPTNTDGLCKDQWGLGFTGVVLKQSGPWTIGFLGNHVWSVTNTDTYGDSSVTFLQPFVSYTTPKATTFALNTETTYDWEAEEWSIPINASVAQLVKIAGRPVSLTAGLRYWADAPDNGPEGLGARLAVTYLFPKG